MAFYKPRGDMTVDAFQWLGGDQMPGMLSDCAPHLQGDGVLTIRVAVGTASAMPGDWVVRAADGFFEVMSDARFRAAYDVEAAEKETARAHKPAPAPDAVRKP